MEDLVEVSVFVEKGRGQEALYPVVLNFYKRFLLFGPLIGQLVRNMPAYFHCKVLGASQVSCTLLTFHFCLSSLNSTVHCKKL